MNNKKWDSAYEWKAVGAIMGVAEEAFTPTSIAATAEASHPKRLGMNIGIQQAFFPLLGLGLAPIVATQLLLIVPSWRWVFVLVSVPGFLIAWALYRVLREPHKTAPAAQHVEATSTRWTTVLRQRNVLLNIACMFCMLTCLFVSSVMLPNYLTDYLHMGMQQMGFVMALWLMIQTGAEPVKLFLLLFATTFFNFSMICLTVGPLTSESVPPALVSTATGLVVVLFLRETAPHRLVSKTKVKVEAA